MTDLEARAKVLVEEIQKKDVGVTTSIPEPASEFTEPTVEVKLEPAPQEPEQQDDAATVQVLEDEKPKEPENHGATAYFAYSDAGLFKKLFDAMSLLQDEVTWKFDLDSLSVRHMDPSRVAMFECVVSKEVFEEWNVAKPGCCSFNVAEIKKIVFGTPFKKGTVMKVSVDGDGRVTFTLKDNRTRERSFPTLEAPLEEVPTPKIDFKARCKVTAKELAEDFENIAKLSGYVTLIGTQENFEMKVEGDYAKGSTTYKRGDSQLLDIELIEESKASYSLSYLKDFVIPCLSDIALVQFSTDMPLKLTLPSKFGDLNYYLAPRIGTDD